MSLENRFVMKNVKEKMQTLLKIATCFAAFNGLRLESLAKLLLCSGCRDGETANDLYYTYPLYFISVLIRLTDSGAAIPYLPQRNDLLGKVIAHKRWLVDGEKSVSLHG